MREALAPARAPASHGVNLSHELVRTKHFFTALAVCFSNFHGRFYTPLVPASTSKNPYTAGASGVGYFDWFEAGRLRAGTVLWTEDVSDWPPHFDLAIASEPTLSNRVYLPVLLHVVVWR